MIVCYIHKEETGKLDIQEFASNFFIANPRRQSFFCTRILTG